MQAPGPTATAIGLARDTRSRIAGRRGVITFTPTVASSEVLTAGVVVQVGGGTVFWRSALDRRKAAHAFGADGEALVAITERLCESLADHWTHDKGGEWRPPFDGAMLAQVEEFTARDATSALDHALRMDSSLYVLLSAYEMKSQARPSDIVRRVKSVITRREQSAHLGKRFGRALDMGHEAGTLKVDFLGQNFACYFLALTQSQLGVESNTERALAKLYELAALRRFVQKRRKSLGLFDDERPHRFELVAVGLRDKAPQRQAYARIETLADDKEVLVRSIEDAPTAAAHVIQMERAAA
jgi:hypothetical protein